MASIGSLAAILSINSAAFTAGLAQAQASLESFAAKARDAISGIPLVGGTFAGLASFAGATAAITSGLDDIASRAKESDRLGISMQEVAGFAGLAGSKSEQMAHAVNHLNKELGALESGSKEAAKKFADLGFTAEQFKGADVAQAYRMVADAVAKSATQAEKFNIADQLLGPKGGGELVGILQKGGAALDEFGQKARDAGQVLDRSVAQQAIEAKKAIAQLNTALAAAKEQLAITAAPLLTRVTDTFTNMLKQPGLLGKFDIAQAILTRARPGDAFTAAGQAQQEKHQVGMQAAARQAEEFGAELKKVTDHLDAQKIAQGAGAHASEISKVAILAENDAQRASVEILKARAQALDEMAERAKRSAEMERDAAKVVEENMSTLEKFQAEMNELRGLEEAGLISGEERMKAAMRNADKLRSALGVDQGPGVVSAAEAGSAQAQQTLAAVEARSAFEGFDDLKNLIQLGNEVQKQIEENTRKFAERNQEILAASF